MKLVRRECRPGTPDLPRSILTVRTLLTLRGLTLGGVRHLVGSTRGASVLGRRVRRVVVRVAARGRGTCGAGV